MSNEEKIEFDTMLDIAQEEQEKRDKDIISQLKTKHAPMIDGIFDYFLLILGKQEFKDEFYRIVTSWYLQAPHGTAKVWIEENNKAIETEHEMQLRYDI